MYNTDCFKADFMDKQLLVVFLLFKVLHLMGYIAILVKDLRTFKAIEEFNLLDKLDLNNFSLDFKFF